MPLSHPEALAENAVLRGQLAAERIRNRQLINALADLICHLGGHPGTDRLLADLKNSEGPPAPHAEGPTSPASPGPSTTRESSHEH
jgi:hypothetical protein